MAPTKPTTKAIKARKKQSSYAGLSKPRLTKSKRSPDQKVTNEKKDYFRTRLPGELRNKIYRLILPPPSIIHIHVCGTGRQYACHCQQADFYRRDVPNPVVLRYRAPTLLRVSKYIRNEAGSIYYGENTFHVPIGENDYEKACAWFIQAAKLSRKAVVNQFMIDLRQVKWSDIQDWLHVATLFRGIQDGVASSADLQLQFESTLLPRRSYEGRSDKHFLLRTFLEVLNLGRVAREQNLSAQAAEGAFTEWMRNKVGDKTFSPLARRKMKQALGMEVKTTKKKAVLPMPEVDGIQGSNCQLSFDAFF